METRIQKERDCNGFTLMELLVTIGIIAVLMALLVPTASRVLVRGKVTKAHVETVQLANAWRAYYLEYNKWPQFGLPGYGDAEDETDTGIEMEDSVVRMLQGEDEPSGVNPRRRRFMEFPQNAIRKTGPKIGAFEDPWGNPYKFMLDYDHDGILEIVFTDGNDRTNLQRNVGVWSRGPDMSDKFSADRVDDPQSWK